MTITRRRRAVKGIPTVQALRQRPVKLQCDAGLGDTQTMACDTTFTDVEKERHDHTADEAGQDGGEEVEDANDAYADVINDDIQRDGTRAHYGAKVFVH